MKLFLLLLSLPAFGQVTISSIVSNSVTDVAARINVTLSSSATVYVQCGLTTSYGQRCGVSSGTTNSVINIYGLVPGILHHYRVCQTGFTPPTGCTADQELTTTAASAFLPTTATAVNTTYPTSFTNTYPVAADCSDLTTQISTAMGQDGNNNYLVSIPAGAICGSYVGLEARTGSNPTGTGTIVIASDGVIAPDGTRISEDYYTQGRMVRVMQNTVNTVYIDGEPPAPNPPTRACKPLSFQFWHVTDIWYACLTLNTWTAVSATSGYSTGSGVPSSASCDNIAEVGRYYERTGVDNQGLYFCHASLKWIFINPSNGGQPGPAGYAFAFGANSQKFRLVGLYFDHLFDNYGYDNQPVGVDPGAENITIDRCIFKNQRTTGQGPIGLDGINTALINSIVDQINWGYNGAQQSAVRLGAGPGPIKIDNNTIKGCYVPIFNPNPDPTNVTISSNSISLQHECNPADPLTNGRTDYDTRTLIESKYGKIWSIIGNVFTNFYTPLQTGSQILFSIRAESSSGGDDNDVHLRDLDVSYNIFKDGFGGGGGLEAWGSDDQGYRNPRPTARVRFSNNLGYNLIGQTYRSPMVYAQDGSSKLTIESNTWYNVQGTAPSLITFVGQFGGFKFRRNINWINTGGVGGSGDGDGGGVRYIVPGGFSTWCDESTTTGTAKDRLDKCAVQGDTPSYDFTGNAIVGGATGYTATYSSQYPAGNEFVGDTTTGITALGFSPVGDYRLRYNSTFAANGFGADMDMLDQKMGVTKYARSRLITTGGATISYSAPDAAVSCSVDHGTSATFASFTRASDTPGGVRPRNVALTGYGSAATVYFRINCSQAVTGSFVTR